MKISVCITSYNQRTYLIEAIESVLNQTLKPFEVIIADDCSTDGSQELIERYAQKHSKLIRSVYQDRNQGVARNRSAALEQVRGKLATCLDGDDRFLPSKLEREFETFVSHPEAEIVYSNVYYIDADGRRTGLWADSDDPPPSGQVFLEAFSREFPRNSLFRNELVNYACFREVGFYDASCQSYEDWDMKIRLTKRFNVAYCDEPLTEYRRHPGTLSRSSALVHLSSRRKVYEKNRHLLDDLPEAERIKVEKAVSRKSRQFSRRAAVEELRKGNRKPALKHWLESLDEGLDLRFVAQVVLPKWAFLRLRVMYRSIRNMGR